MRLHAIRKFASEGWPTLANSLAAPSATSSHVVIQGNHDDHTDDNGDDNDDYVFELLARFKLWQFVFDNIMLEQPMGSPLESD